MHFPLDFYNKQLYNNYITQNCSKIIKYYTNNVTILNNRGEVLHMSNLYEQVHHISGNNLPLKIYRTSGVYLHWHDEYEFIIIEKGSATCMINGEAVKLNQDSVAFLQNGVMHSMQCSKNTEVTAIVVSPSLWANKTDVELFDGQITYQRIFYTSNKIDLSVINILKHITKIYDNHDWGYEFQIKAKFTELFDILINNGRFSLEYEKNKKKPKEFQNLIHYIHEHYIDKITLDTLSELSFYSPTYIIGLFKKYTNLTPAEYIIQYRLNLAKNKLQSSSDTNLSIALSCGFNSESYFIQAFKRRYGMTPHIYRKELFSQN